MVNYNKFNSNIWKYYLATSLAQFAFYIPIIQLFYLANDLTITKIAFLGVVWTIVKLILEIPSSILADKWGRKNTLILSSIFAILQLVTILYANNNYLFFLLASVWSATSCAFLSGTDVAFFYDNLKLLKKENEFDKLWARQQIYQQIPLLVAFISSGFLFEFSHLLPFQLSLIFLFFSITIMFTLKEPQYHKSIKNIAVFSHFKQSIKFVFKNNHLKQILIFTIIFSIGSDLSYGYGQIYLKQLALPIFLFGIVYTFKSLFVTFAANICPLLRRRFSYSNIFAFQIISLTILLYLMVLAKDYILGSIFFILIAIPHGFFVISKTNYIHNHIQSHNRATVDSIFSFFIALVILVIEPIFGYLSDLYTIKFPLLLIAITLTLYCFYYLFNVSKKI